MTKAENDYCEAHLSTEECLPFHREMDRWRKERAEVQRDNYLLTTRENSNASK